MNEMIINILTVGPSSIEITLPTGEMITLKNWGERGDGGSGRDLNDFHL